MFTLQQIKDAHSKVKSGADFPTYVKDLIGLGLISYDMFVADGHAVYYGKGKFSISSEAKYEPLIIAEQSNTQQFQSYLKSHQQGHTDYLSFCRHAAETGVEKWTVNTDVMTCTYYDLKGNTVFEELIYIN